MLLTRRDLKVAPAVEQHFTPDQSPVKPLTQQLSLATVGIEMGGCVAVGFLFGSWLDGKWESAPYATTFFTLCGLGAAFKAVLRVYRIAKQPIVTEREVDSRD
jgi:F0F1-type ATP synthase assembly protein I